MTLHRPAPLEAMAAEIVSKLTDRFERTFSELQVKFEESNNRIPTTVPSSVQSLGDEGAAHPIPRAPSSHHLHNEFHVCDLTEWIIYERSNVEPDHYIKKILKTVKSMKELRFKVVKSSAHVKIYDGTRQVFRCARNISTTRNLYLELHNFRFDFELWLRERTDRFDSNYDYKSHPTPPELYC